MSRPHNFHIVMTALCMAFVSCTSTSQRQILATNTSQVQLRSYQTRAFDTTDKTKTVRTVMATMQDLGFVLDNADLTIGTVSGTKAVSGQNQVVRMTTTVRPRGEKQMLVRTNAQYGLQAIEDPTPYQDFFTSLQKAMFLTAHDVE